MTRAVCVLLLVLALFVSPVTAQSLSIRLVSVTSPAYRGTDATLTVQTAPGASCDIAVYYKSGPSRARGLYPKAVNTAGRVTWVWRVAPARHRADGRLSYPARSVGGQARCARHLRYGEVAMDGNNLAQFVLESLVPASSAEWFTGVGAALLLYRTYLTLSGQFSHQPQDVAALASVSLPTTYESVTASFGFPRTLDFEKVYSLLRERVIGQVGMLLVLIGAVLSVAGATVPRGEVALTRIAAAGLVGVASSWTFTRGYFALWERTRAWPWVARAWLSWLELCIPDPLSPSFSPSQSLQLLAKLWPHPDLQRFLEEQSVERADDVMTPADWDALERWIADLAVKTKHRFDSAEWKQWVRQHKSPNQRSAPRGWFPWQRSRA